MVRARVRSRLAQEASDPGVMEGEQGTCGAGLWQQLCWGLRSSGNRGTVGRLLVFICLCHRFVCNSLSKLVI